MKRAASAFWKRIDTGWLCGPTSGPPLATTLPVPTPISASSADCTCAAVALKGIGAVVSCTAVTGRVKVSVNVPPVGLPVIEIDCREDTTSRMPESRSRPSCGTFAGISSVVGVRICRFGFRPAHTSSRKRESWIGWKPNTSSAACCATSGDGGDGGGESRSASCRNISSRSFSSAGRLFDYEIVGFVHCGCEHLQPGGVGVEHGVLEQRPGALGALDSGQLRLRGTAPLRGSAGRPGTRSNRRPRCPARSG